MSAECEPGARGGLGVAVKVPGGKGRTGRSFRRAELMSTGAQSSCAMLAAALSCRACSGAWLQGHTAGGHPPLWSGPLHDGA